MASANRSKATSIFLTLFHHFSSSHHHLCCREPISGDGFLKAKPTPQCNTVVGVASGDTCYDLAKQFKMTTELFYAVNPNINCDALFVGQWVCVAGTA
ncbi:hypothetical protein JRO89_XS08G0077600 [Xanthoceras sorbifolium]|uniref:LysM domain-containing protein n=1 Tax=Xanthoceras sorbifolium TaxID=99658 RepID=A0ABQ8HNZ8_9ROSI|nr:hypothetical protein JRO89_XS08G0077600 [Xanthoceras sorbifolium]